MAAGRRCAALLVAALVSMTAPPVARGGPGQAGAVRDPGPGRFWSRLLADAPDGPDLAGAWVAAAQSAALSRRPFAQAGKAPGTSPDNGPYGHVMFRDVALAGDLDGDRVSDVVDLAHTMRSHRYIHATSHFDVTAYRGRSGARLWSRRVRPPEARCQNPGCGYFYRMGFAYPLELANGNGVEIIVLSAAADNPGPPASGDLPVAAAGGAIFSFYMAQVDGRGRLLWSRTMEGRVDSFRDVITFTGLPVLQGYGRTESGKVDDWLFTVSDGRLVSTATVRRNVQQALWPTGLNPYVPDATLFESKAVAIDGRTGKPRTIGEPVSGPGAVRDLSPVGDLSGDKRDDIVETHPRSEDWSLPNRRGPGDGVVTALRSSDGAAVWRRVLPAGEIPAAVTSAGDMTGDRKAEVLAVVEPATPGGTPMVAALDGATGADRWRKQAAELLVLRHVGAGRSRALIASLDVERRTVRVASYDGSGKRLWTRDVRVPASGAAELVGAIAYDAGDLDGDGWGDATVAGVTVTTTTSGNTTTTRYASAGTVFLTASGRLLPRAKNANPMYAALDGRGDDTSTSHATGITVRSGHTAQPLWQVDFGRRALFVWAETDGAARRCGSLLATAYYAAGDGYSVVAGMFDRSGRLRWTRTFGKPVAARPRTTARAYRC